MKACQTSLLCITLWIQEVIHALTVAPKQVIHALTVAPLRINGRAPNKNLYLSFITTTCNKERHFWGQPFRLPTSVPHLSPEIDKR